LPLGIEIAAIIFMAVVNVYEKSARLCALKKCTPELADISMCLEIAYL